MQRVLIIDNEECIRETLGLFCKEMGYEPVLLEEPNHSLPCQVEHECPLETPCVNALLTDHYLPTMFGLSFLEKLSGRGCKIPEGARAVTSVVLSSQEIERANDIGCKVLLKPVTYEKLKGWLNTVLQ
jgi:CheY-like chemotaxis protein